MTCHACAIAATNPRTSHYRGDCIECQTRSLANGPEHHASREGRRITPEYRHALDTLFGKDLEAGHKAVKAWVEKIHGAPA